MFCVILLCFESLQTVSVKTDHDLSQLSAECPNTTNKKANVKMLLWVTGLVFWHLCYMMLVSGFSDSDSEHFLTTF